MASGTPGDYNRWKALGIRGGDDLETYFVKSEKARSHSAASFRGHDGIVNEDEDLTNAQYVISYISRRFAPSDRAAWNMQKRNWAYSASPTSTIYAACTGPEIPLAKPS